MDFGNVECLNCGESHNINIGRFSTLSLEEQQKELRERKSIFCSAQDGEKLNFYILCLSCMTLNQVERKKSFFKGEHFVPIKKVDTSNYTKDDWAKYGDDLLSHLEVRLKYFDKK